MSSTVVGFFDTQAQAEQARQRLLEAGFESSSVLLAGGSQDDASGATTLAASDTGASAPQHENPIVRFFKELFGSDDPQAHGEYGSTYREAFRRGAYGVTVRASDEADVDRAERVLNECGAVDIDERSQQWRSEGWTAGGAAGYSAGVDSSRTADTTAGSATTSTLASSSMNQDTVGGSSSDERLSGQAASQRISPVAGDDMAAGATSAIAGGIDSSTRGMGTDTQGELAPGTTQRLQEIEENLVVGKRGVARGGVRVFSRVVEVPVSETVTLREEVADVQRRTVDRPATEADIAAFKEGTIEVRQTGEEAVVGKSARVVGEVEVGKHVTERQETVDDTVRKTEVHVEPIRETAGGPATTGGSATTGATGAGGTARTDTASGPAGTPRDTASDPARTASDPARKGDGKI